MNKLTAQETAKIFAMHFPCQINGDNAELKAINFETNEYLITVNSEFSERIIPFEQSKIKMRKKPLSKITNEHAIQAAKFEFGDESDNETLLKMWKSQWAKYGVKKDWHYTANTFQYLVKENYAMPLWFGLGHWANGKDAFELGVAEIM